MMGKANRYKKIVCNSGKVEDLFVEQFIGPSGWLIHFFASPRYVITHTVIAKSSNDMPAPSSNN